MSTNERQKLEQEALQQLNRGSTDGALRAYLAILKLDPRDRRVRQKVGEIFLRQGKNAEAEKHLREVAEGLLKEGNHRAAVAVLKQLVGLRPDAPELQADLGECYAQSGYAADAKACFEAATKAWLALGKPALAAKPARRLAELAPGELPLKLRVAELLEAGQDAAGAAAAYQEVLDEFRRRGRMDEVGRIAELALRVRPDDIGLLLDAAAARVATGDFKRALQALQTAFAASPKEPRTLDLLSRAFEGAGQPDRALRVLIELSRIWAERGDHAAEVEVLRRAAVLAPDDGDIAGRLAGAEDHLGRFEKKLTTLECAQPHTESELRTVVRAEVFGRYGFHEMGESELRAALVASADSIPVIASLAEVLVAAGRVTEALSWMERVVPRAGSESNAVLDRMALLRGTPPPGPLADDDVVDDVDADSALGSAAPPARVPAGVAPPEIEAADPAAGPEAEGDRLAGLGDPSGALQAYRRVLAEDPLNEGVLVKIAGLRTQSRMAAGTASPGPVAPTVAFGRPDRAPPLGAARHEPLGAEEPGFLGLSEGTFAEIEPSALDDVDDSEPLDHARALAAVGEGEQALNLVRGIKGLAARVVEAQALRAMSNLSGALDVLRAATNDAPESDPAYAEALFDLAGLYTATQKHRSAVRLLEELKDIAPDFRPSEVESRMRGLQLLSR